MSIATAMSGQHVAMREIERADDDIEYSLHAEEHPPEPKWRRRGAVVLTSLLLLAALFHIAHGRAIGTAESAAATLNAKAAAPRCANGFPRDFIWGLGTAAYQIEGGANLTGRQPSIWDKFSHVPGKVHNGDTGDDACDHFHRIREDAGLMQSIGLKHYRFSISWSRVMSYDTKAQTMVPNEEGLRFYDELLSALEEHGIVPYVTLYHWDLPLTLHDHLGGWHTPDNQRMLDEFVKYAELCFGRYGKRVRFWVTFNEPWSFTVEGYDSGKSAPGCAPYKPEGGRCDNGGEVAYIVGHNVLNTHAAAAAKFHEVYQPKHGGTISITLNSDFSLPASKSAADIAAAERANEFMLGWWLQPLVSGDYPEVMREYVGERLPRFSPEQAALLMRSTDVFTLNHYSTHLVRDVGRVASTAGDAIGQAAYSAWAADQKISSTFDESWPESESPWLRSYPPGFRALLAWAAGPHSGRWKGAMYVTENGWSCHSMTAEEAKRDQEQVTYISEYTEQMRLAMDEDGVDVRGYFGWSLFDNYEWADGYSKRFGLFFVDYETQERTPKLAAHWWKKTRSTC